MTGELCLHHRVLARVVAALVLASASAAEEPAHELTIRWVDSYGVFDVGSKALGNHVRASFERLGASVQWNHDSTLAAAPKEREFVVHLRPSEPAQLGFPAQTMGVVFGARGHASNIWVFFPTIVRAVDPRKAPRMVGRATPRGTAYETPELERLKKLAWLERERVARAMGAVVVHEVIHAVVPETAVHASEGVMSANLNRVSLLDAELPVDSAAAHAFTGNLAAAVSGKSVTEKGAAPDATVMSVLVLSERSRRR